MEAFPTVADLAVAPEDKVLRLWQGLGYYSRARNLHATAKFIHQELNDQFPSSASELMKLKGIGPYTAAAIASICFNEPVPVVDGNVFRFASRYFGIEEDISSTKARKAFEEVLKDHISINHPDLFNQGMMEYGATICTPSSPKCSECVFSQACYAAKHQAQGRLPIKTKKTKTRERVFNYIVFKHQEVYYLKQRKAGDVWQGLYDFYLIEGRIEEESVLKHISGRFEKQFEVESISEHFKHILSHQLIHARFFEISLSERMEEIELQKTGLSEYSIEEMLNLPKPKLIVNYLNHIGIN